MHSFAGVCIVGWMPWAEFSLWLFSLFQAICSMDQRLLLLEATCFVGVRFRFLSFASHFVAIGEIPDWDALPRKLSVWFVCGRVLELCPPPRAHLFIMVRPAQLFLEHKTRCRPVQAVYLLPNDRRNGCGLFTEFHQRKLHLFFLTQKIFYSSRSSRDTARAFFTWNIQCEWASFRLSLNSLFPTPASFYGRRVLWKNSFRALTRTSPFSNFFFIHSVGTSISRRRVHWIFRLQFQRHVTFWTNVQ